MDRRDSFVYGAHGAAAHHKALHHEDYAAACYERSQWDRLNSLEPSPLSEPDLEARYSQQCAAVDLALVRVLKHAPARRSVGDNFKAGWDTIIQHYSI